MHLIEQIQDIQNSVQAKNYLRNVMSISNTIKLLKPAQLTLWICSIARKRLYKHLLVVWSQSISTKTSTAYKLQLFGYSRNCSIKDDQEVQYITWSTALICLCVWKIQHLKVFSACHCLTVLTIHTCIISRLIVKAGMYATKQTRPLHMRILQAWMLYKFGWSVTHFLQTLSLLTGLLCPYYEPLLWFMIQIVQKL